MKYICRIGNNAQNDLVLTDQTAADFHAHLIMDNHDRVWIKDLTTKYGTRINGKKITKAELTYSDEVRIGFTIIDWIGVRNKWLEGSGLYIDANEWSEPLRHEKSKETATSEISQQLASEAVKLKKEYNPKEIGSIEHLKHDVDERPKLSSTNNEEDDLVRRELIQSNSKIEEESIDSAPTFEISDIKAETSDSEIEVDPLEIVVHTNDEIKLDIAKIPTSKVESLDSLGVENSETNTLDSVDVETGTEENAESELKNSQIDQAIQDSSVNTLGKVDELRPITIRTSTGIRFDYRGYAEKKETSNSLAVVRVVARTNVPNYEKPKDRPKSLGHSKLIIRVIALVFAMLFAGWFIAFIGGN